MLKLPVASNLIGEPVLFTWPTLTGVMVNMAKGGDSVTPGLIITGLPSTITVTSSGLVDGAVMVKVAGSNVRLKPEVRVVIPVVPSVATKLISTMPEPTVMVTLLHVPIMASPASSVTMAEPPQRLTVAGPIPPDVSADILTPAGLGSSETVNDWSPLLVIVPMVVPPMPTSLKSLEKTAG